MEQKRLQNNQWVKQKDLKEQEVMKKQVEQEKYERN